MRLAHKLHNDIVKAEANKGKRQTRLLTNRNPDRTLWRREDEKNKKLEVFHYVVSSQK